jgi:predicted phosphoribosyltransferase
MTAERTAVERAVARWRAVRPRLRLDGATAIVVDDGIATGASVRAALAVARAHRADRLVVATPVAPADVVAARRADVDGVVVAAVPDDFVAVGPWYRDFRAVDDDEVTALLAAAAQVSDS